jgi:hypothetical protein
MEEKNNQIDINIAKKEPKIFQQEFEEFLDLVHRPIRGCEESIKSKSASVVAKDNGQVNIAAGLSHRKASPNGTIEDISFKHSVKTNTHHVETEDEILNNHKLNNKIYELTGYKEVLNDGRKNYQCVVGNFTVLGTVLTKCWEPHLQRYVLIRRLANVPLYSPNLGTPEILEGLNLSPNVQKMQELAKEVGLINIDSPTEMVEDAQNKKIAERMAIK